MDQKKNTIVLAGKKEIKVDVEMIMYVMMDRNVAEIHLAGGEVYKTRMTMAELEETVGDYFIKVDRGCLVSALAIHSIGKTIDLVNGESLPYVVRRKKEIQARFAEMQRNVIQDFHATGAPGTPEEYNDYFRSFDKLPIAFTDIEMVFNEENNAVDWIFRYGNEALAKLEKLPLEKMIGSSFGSLFSNMDSKWLRSYERTALYGETLEIIDYSPEIDTYLNVICFPTFRGHCGCILFDISDLKFAQANTESQRAMRMYFERLMSFHAN